MSRRTRAAGFEDEVDLNPPQVVLSDDEISDEEEEDEDGGLGIEEDDDDGEESEDDGQRSRPYFKRRKGLPEQEFGSLSLKGKETLPYSAQPNVADASSPYRAPPYVPYRPG